jgi:hypothetical protein
MLGSVKVLVGKDDRRNYRGVHIKRTIVTTIECISADGRYLNPMIIWPATTHPVLCDSKQTNVLYSKKDV